MTQLLDTWTTEAGAEDHMTDEHAWIWAGMIGALPPGDLTSSRVLDVGCNQGGFLRMLYDTRPFAWGLGVDLARDRVALAEAAKGTRPVDYVASSHLSEAGTGFDIAFSHEVIYLMEDLLDHGRQVYDTLVPGGHYDAVTCCHRDNPLWATWRPHIAQISNIPVPNHSIDDISAAFRGAGFDVSVSRFLAAAQIPVYGPNDYFPTDADRVEVYARWKLLFRCTRPG